LNKTNISTIRQKSIFIPLPSLSQKAGKPFHSNKINQFPMQAHTLYTASLICLSYWIACSSRRSTDLLVQL